MHKYKLPPLEGCNIAIIGLGYVGLPLAIEFAKNKISFSSKKILNYKITGFDVNKERIDNLNRSFDENKEINLKEFNLYKDLKFTYKEEDLHNNDIFIIAVPTPIDKNNKPDLTYIKKATEIVAKALLSNKSKSKNNNFSQIIIYESTVYPGTTEEECIPLIEELSKLKNNIDFVVGYSPERINPGYNQIPLTKIKKVVSGSDQFITNFIGKLYSSIIQEGVFKAKSIKVAEASKVVENTQRDVNIAFVNQISIIMEKLGINTNDVLEAASTKWNFLNFKPGLVGGHCIGIDPYYLIYKSNQMGYEPDLLTSARVINSFMPIHIKDIVHKHFNNGNFISENIKILILGFSFKENCSDFRNTLVEPLYKSLLNLSYNVDIFDDYVDKEKVKETFDIELKESINDEKKYDMVILAVPHQSFLDFDTHKWDSLLSKNGVIFDLKSELSYEERVLTL